MPTRRKTVQQVKADVFIAIAHPVRRQILQHLTQGESSVARLAEPFDISRSAISQHLTILLESGLVSREKQGREQLYHLRPENLNEIREWMQHFDRQWREKLDSLETILDEIAEQEDDEH